MRLPQIHPLVDRALRPLHGRLMRSYFGAISIQGHDFLPDRGPFVLACKHFSRWDPLVVGLLAPQPLYFMTDSVQMQGLQGWVIKHLGAYPVDRDKPDKTSLRLTIDLLAAGQRLVIFPEGGIEREHSLRSLKPGLARIVLQAETLTQQSIPIIPVALRYAPDSVRRANVQVIIDRPITSEQFSGATPKLKAQQMTEAIAIALRRNLA
jgi:1-acyl-sn-glycerol-3-phosphate acyltransferase